MQRYFIDNIDKTRNTATIQGADFHHIKNVMRSTIGDQIIVCNNAVCYRAKIASFGLDEVHCLLFEEVESPVKLFEVTIAQGLIRRERFEYMLQKSTELGADFIIPMVSQYSIINIDPQKINTKVERWNKITKEASEQAHRNTTTIVTAVTDIKSIKYNQYDVVIVAYEKENMSHNLKQLLHETFKNILILIGPEGGFTDQEVQFLSGFSNVEFVGLGHRILRSETASSYILSVLHYEYEMKL